MRHHALQSAITVQRCSDPNVTPASFHRVDEQEVVNDVILPNWDVFQWMVTEIGVGVLLILGLVSRGAALVGLLFQLFLALVYASSNRWMFEQPHEYIPLFILAIVPTGRYWGLDGPLLRDRSSLRRWPF